MFTHEQQKQNGSYPEQVQNANTGTAPKKRTDVSKIETAGTLNRRKKNDVAPASEHTALSQPEDAHEVQAQQNAKKVVSGESVAGNNTAQINNTAGNSKAALSPDFINRLNRRKGSGKALDETQQETLGNQLGKDLSDVKLHTDAEAAELSASINADAFTKGNDIYFAAGKYAPETNDGKELLAHELGHVGEAGEMVFRAPENGFHIANIEIHDEIKSIRIFDLKGNEVNCEQPKKIKSNLFQIVFSPPQVGVYLVSILTINDKNEAGKFLALEMEPYTINFNLKEASTYVSMETTGDYHPATTFEELIDLVAIAEKELKGAGQDVKTRIKTIRGMFYGTEWSIDWDVEKSAMRNFAFTYFLYGKDAVLTTDNMYYYKREEFDKIKPVESYLPGNPEKILGNDLFIALKKSFEVPNKDSRQVDFGHLIIGLEARLNESSRKNDVKDLKGVAASEFVPFGLVKPATMGGSGLELTTWVGDLGGGASKLAFDRLVDPKTDASTVFPDSGSSYGATVNLEGDIAAFVAGRNSNKKNGMPELFISEEGGIAEVLKSYLLPDKYAEISDWDNRARIFLEMYGASFDADSKLKNEAEILSLFSAKIMAFGNYYRETRATDEYKKALGKGKDYKLTDEDNEKISKFIEPISKNIPAAAKDIAALFIKALMNVVKDKSKPIHP